MSTIERRIDKRRKDRRKLREIKQRHQSSKRKKRRNLKLTLTMKSTGTISL
jgi:hypothetical protein